MSTNKVGVRMAPGELDQIMRSGFARLVAIQLEPGMLQNGRLHCDGALDDGVELRSVAAHVGLQFANADHRPVPHAAIELPQTEVKKKGTQKDRPVGPLGEALDGQHDPIVFLADLAGAGMKLSRLALRKN